MGAARKLQLESGQSDDLQQRLGEPAQLALFAGEQYHARSFWGRHPWVTYLLGPLPLLVAMWVLYLAAIWIPTYCIGTFCERMGWVTAPESETSANGLLTQAIVLACFTWGLVVLPPLGAALSLCRVYRRNALDWRWPVVGCAVLAILVAAIHVSWRLKTGTGAKEHGMVMFGIVPYTYTPQAFSLISVKFALAMGIGLLLVKRAQRQSVAAAINLGLLRNEDGKPSVAG